MATRIPFHDLVPGSEGVRFTQIENVPYMSVRDIIMVVCNQDNDRAGKTWRNVDETLKDEVRQFLTNFQFPGRGQSAQPVITLQGALKLIMWLPGNMAKEFRSKACDILTRYLPGDGSLVGEIQANATSGALVGEVTRETRISFKSILPNAEDVRVTDDVPPLIWAVDLTMAVTGKDRRHANECLADLNTDIFEAGKIGLKVLPGNGKWPVKLVTFEHALELVMVLPGATAKAIRVQFCDILKRYFAGDQTLHGEIQANAASDAPINHMARASLKREFEDLELECKIKRMKLELREREVEVEQRKAEVQERYVALYRSLCPGGVIDDRASIMFKDKVLNLVGGTGNAPRLAIENGDGNPMSVSDMVTAMGKHFDVEDCRSIGGLVAAKYRERYGPDTEPGKHPQLVGGRSTLVNHYVEKDHDLLRDVISNYVRARQLPEQHTKRNIRSYFV